MKSVLCDLRNFFIEIFEINRSSVLFIRNTFVQLNGIVDMTVIYNITYIKMKFCIIPMYYIILHL